MEFGNQKVIIQTHVQGQSTEGVTNIKQSECCESPKITTSEHDEPPLHIGFCYDIQKGASELPDFHVRTVEDTLLLGVISRLSLTSIVLQSCLRSEQAAPSTS